jgi:adenosyl cobinamide kinase/adenosyl cobinamide phosphate guanylyltransferase
VITLVLGGARSGKSAVAEALLTHASGTVTYLATSVIGDDQDFIARVAQHQRRRPIDWTTIECGAHLVEALIGLEGAVMIDSLGAWLAGWPDFKVDAGALLEGLSRCSGEVVVVSDEAGLGVHPSSDVGRAFRDALGVLNQAVAQRADTVLLVVAGQVLTLKSRGSG